MKITFAFGHLNRPESITRTCYSIGARETFNEDHLADVLRKRKELFSATDTSASTPVEGQSGVGADADIYSKEEMK